MEPKPKRRITPQDLIGLRLPGETAVSPDGTRVAFTLTTTEWGKGGLHTQIHLTPDAGAEPGPSDRKLTFGLDDAGRPEWSPDGKHLAFITFRPQPHEDEEDDQREDGTAKHQVFLLPVEGGEARRLTEAPEGVEDYVWWPDGSGVAWLGQAPRSTAEQGWRRHRRETKDDPIVVHADIPEWEIWFQPLEGKPHRLLGGIRGLSDFDISPDGKWLAYATNHTGRNEDNEKTEIILRELETGQERQASGGRGGQEGEPLFTACGRYLCFTGWNDPRVAFSRQELLAVDLQNPEKPPIPLMAGLNRDVEEFVAVPDGRVAVLAAWGLESRLVFLDPGGKAPSVTRLEGRYLHGLSAARKGGALAVIVESGEDVPEVALVNPDGRLDRLTALNPESSSWRRAERRRVQWENEGLAHEGLLLLPAPEDRLPGGKPPVLVWVHGGPHWRVVDILRVYEAEALAAAGWAIFMPQFRGSSGYDEDYALKLKGDLGGGDARDILAGLESLVEKGLVDGARAAIGGASHGGYLTNWILATTDRFRAGISVCGIFDLAQDYSTSAFGSWEVHYLGGTPWENPEVYRERSPLSRVADLSAPVLILHGLDDDNTLVTNSKALYRALCALHRKAELVVYPREGHGLIEPAHRVDAHTRMVSWLNQHVLDLPAPHVTGRPLTGDGVRLNLLDHQTRREYCGIRPAPGWIFLEVAGVLNALENGPDVLRLAPAGPDAGILLIDGQADRFRPTGVTLEVQGQTVLFPARGTLEAWRSEDGRPAVLPFNAVFEIPNQNAVWTLQVSGLPAVVLEVHAEEEDEDEEESP